MLNTPDAKCYCDDKVGPLNHSILEPLCGFCLWNVKSKNERNINELNQNIHISSCIALVWHISTSNIFSFQRNSRRQACLKSRIPWWRCTHLSIYHIPPVPPNSFRVRTWRTRIIILMHTWCVPRHICPGHGWRTVWTSCHGLRYNVEDRDVPNVGGCHLMRCLHECGLSCFTMRGQSRRWRGRWSVWRLHDWVSWQDNTFIAIVCPAALISPPTLSSFVKMMTNNLPRSASCPTNSALHQIPASKIFAPSGFDMTQRGCGERPTQCWCNFGTDRCSIWNVYDHVL